MSVLVCLICSRRISKILPMALFSFSHFAFMLRNLSCSFGYSQILRAALAQ